MLFNGYGGTSKFNTGLFNGANLPEGALAVGEGNLCSISQLVGQIASGNILTIVQQVGQYAIGSGQLVSITQEVGAVASGNLCSIRQIVTETGSINPNPSTPVPHYIIRNGFYPVFTIGEYVWPDSQIYDSFQITRTENDASQLTFSLLFRKYTPYGPINFEAFDGAPITLDIYSLNGSIDRVFTGYINKVDIDVMYGTIKCTCTDDLPNAVRNTYALQTSLTGYYDENILGQTNDVWEQLQKRLETVPQVVNTDRYGRIVVSSLLPGSPNITFTDSYVYGNNQEKGDPVVTKLSRSRVVNNINITLAYQYQRRYQANATCTWDWNTDICSMLLDGYSLAQRSVIESAVKGTNWVINPPGITFTELPPAGLYNCGGQHIAFTTVQTSGVQYQDKKDPLGHIINGNDGKPLQEAVGGTSIDSRDLLAKGADWHMSYRWTQNIKESYSLSISAPQSIAQYGLVSQTDNVSVDGSTNNSDWENYKAYFAPTGMEHETDSDIYYLNYTPNRAELANAFNVAANKAKTKILKAHRDNRVTFSVPFTPGLEMYHTVYLNTSRIQAVGKVFSITHNCVIGDGDAYTQVTIALCRSIGSVSDSVFSLPVPPTQVPPNPNWDLHLSSVYGEEPTATFTGFVGNRWKTEADYTFGSRGTNTFKTKIQERFIVKSPEISKTYRDLLTLPASASYTVSIPNNTFTASFL